MLRDKCLQIAIDGPVAAGKGTVAFLLAERLGIEYIDSGAFIRGAALLCKSRGFEINEAEKDSLCEVVKDAKIKITSTGDINNKSRIFIDGQEVTQKIRTPEIDQASSKIASVSKVYKLLTRKLQQLAKGTSLVMEGRNITTSVLPEADLKIYLTADVKERARRRFNEYIKRGNRVEFGFILEEMSKRDTREEGRKFDPLRIVPEAVVVDTTALSAVGVVEELIEILKEQNLLPVK